MATQAVSRRRSRRKKSSNPSLFASWLLLWLVAAAAATPFAVRRAEILPLMGLAGLRQLCLLFPFSILLQHHWPGLAEAAAEKLAQVLLYLQFPLYGVLIFLIGRWKTLAAALVTVLCLHLAAAGAAWLLVLEHA